MRHIEFAPLGRVVSAVGFGCASLGSRVDARTGTAAINRAREAGIDWFDVAPSYGDGHAESILGAALVSKRHVVTICTKVGILPAPISFGMRLVKPLAQKILFS